MSLLKCAGIFSFYENASQSQDSEPNIVTRDVTFSPGLRLQTEEEHMFYIANGWSKHEVQDWILNHLMVDKYLTLGEWTMASTNIHLNWMSIA